MSGEPARTHSAICDSGVMAQGRPDCDGCVPSLLDQRVPLHALRQIERLRHVRGQAARLNRQLDRELCRKLEKGAGAAVASELDGGAQSRLGRPPVGTLGQPPCTRAWVRAA